MNYETACIKLNDRTECLTRQNKCFKTSRYRKPMNHLLKLLISIKTNIYLRGQGLRNSVRYFVHILGSRIL